MNDILKLLQTVWLGAPIVVWLAISFLFMLILVAIIILGVRRIRVTAKNGKRIIVIETSNDSSDDQ